MAVKRQASSIRSFFFQYFLQISLSLLLVVLLGLVALDGAVRTGLVLPANASETLLKRYQENPDLVDVSQLPTGVSYGRYQDGQLVAGDLTPDLGRQAQAYLDHGQQAGSGYFLRVEKGQEVYLFHYQLKASYQNAWMEAHLPNVELLVVLACLGLAGLLIFGVTRRFSRKLTQMIAPLGCISQQVAQQDLDFDLELTDLREVNAVLESMGIMRDSLKESLEKNWQLEREQRDHLAALTHDVKTPMTVIKGNLELLQLTELTGQQRDYVVHGLAHMDKLAHYLQQLRETLTGQQLEPVYHRISVKEWVAEMREALTLLARSQERQLDFDISVGEGEIAVDKDGLLRALENILINAFEYGSSSQPVRITVDSHQGEIAIACFNQGSTFSPQDLRQATQAFYRADQSRNTQSGHIGLGLYIAESIARSHGGRLTLANQDGGACVTLFLPRLSEQAPQG